MHTAAEGGKLDIIKFLSRKFGARIHEKDDCAYTMLHRAAQGGHYQVARYLIQELKLNPQDRDKVGGVDVFQITFSKSACVMHVCMCVS